VSAFSGKKKPEGIYEPEAEGDQVFVEKISEPISPVAGSKCEIKYEDDVCKGFPAFIIIA
jgi:hypothetical protein